jgi:quinohemoprotein amine dehydrogenase
VTRSVLPSVVEFARAGTWALIVAFALASPSIAYAQDDDSEGLPEGGIPIENELILDSCDGCHDTDDTGRMSRISYMRKTPEGWQTTIRRMVILNNVDLEPEAARQIVRYLSNNHGIAPEELRPGLFEVERRLIDYDYEADDDTEFTCIQCHSMGRIITQRRTEEEWDLLMATHRGLYPLSDFQALTRGGRDSGGGYAMDRAVDHLSEAFPLETPEWSAWSATMRAPRLVGTWALKGYVPGEGPIYGRVEISRGDAPDQVETTTTYTFPRNGRTVSRTGSSIIYTGYQWRGRSFEGPGEEGTLREVMLIERDWQTMSGRWFTGAYDEFGPDVTLTRSTGAPVLSAVFPRAVKAGESVEVTVYGAALPGGLSVGDIDFGPGVVVTVVGAQSGDRLTLGLDVGSDAVEGSRDLFIGGVSLEGAVIVFDEVDRIEVTPQAGMARVGGANLPKQYQQFEAIAYSDGPDDEANTDDDLDLGLVDAQWAMEEYSATLDDDDIQYIGTLEQSGRFEPALDGPNPARTGSRNNVGDVWVVATYTPPGTTESLRARAHLIVTVPLYMRWEPWRAGGP